MPPRRGCAATSSSPPALALLLAAACVGFTPARGVLNWAPLDAWLLTANSSVSPTAPAYASMAVYVGNTTGVQYRRSLGLNLTTPFVVASASKWVSTTVIMSVMQQFTRRFNQTTTLGEWVTVPPPLAGVTLRQLLSFTSGMDARVNCSEGSDATGVVAATSDVNFTVCVDQLKAAYAGGLAYPAGTTFHYAGSHMHLAAAAAMAAYDNVRDSYSHTAWASLFGFYVRNPLGLSTITQYFPRNNPHIAGGLFITPDDYANWMQRYFAVRGAPDGLLQAVYIYATENPVVDSSTAIGFSPLSAAGTSWFYAQGNWLECRETTRPCNSVANRERSSPGKWGFYPYTDRFTLNGNGSYWAVLAVGRDGDLATSLRLGSLLWPTIRNVIAADRLLTPSNSPTGSWSPTCSRTATNSATGSTTSSASIGGTGTATPTQTPPATATPSPSGTSTSTVTGTTTATPSTTRTPSGTPTTSGTSTNTLSPGSSSSRTGSPTPTPTGSLTVSGTPAGTPAGTASRSGSGTASGTGSGTPTGSATPSGTRAPTVTSSSAPGSPGASGTPSGSAALTATGSGTPTPPASVSSSASASPSSSASASGSLGAAPTSLRPLSPSKSRSPNGTQLGAAAAGAAPTLGDSGMAIALGAGIGGGLCILLGLCVLWWYCVLLRAGSRRGRRGDGAEGDKADGGEGGVGEGTPLAPGAPVVVPSPLPSARAEGGSGSGGVSSSSPGGGSASPSSPVGEEKVDFVNPMHGQAFSFPPGGRHAQVKSLLGGR